MKTRPSFLMIVVYLITYFIGISTFGSTSITKVDPQTKKALAQFGISIVINSIDENTTAVTLKIEKPSRLVRGQVALSIPCGTGTFQTWWPLALDKPLSVSFSVPRASLEKCHLFFEWDVESTTGDYSNAYSFDLPSFIIPK